MPPEFPPGFSPEFPEELPVLLVLLEVDDGWVAGLDGYVATEASGMFEPGPLTFNKPPEEPSDAPSEVLLEPSPEEADLFCADIQEAHARNTSRQGAQRLSHCIGTPPKVAAVTNRAPFSRISYS